MSESVLTEYPVETQPGMHVPARVVADAALLEGIRRDRSLAQLLNVTTLPGTWGAVVGMPDMHEGYGFPVGGVAATLLPDGAISPGGIGFDINCGVRLLASAVQVADVEAKLEAFVHELSRSVPMGFGRHGRLSLSAAELDAVLEQGSSWVVRERGMGTLEDLAHTESGGHLRAARADAVTHRARERGRDQLGTLGGGNHFLGEGWAVARYGTPGGATWVYWIVDLPAAAGLGAALSLIPAGTAQAAAKEGKFTEALLDNFREVMNVGASMLQPEEGRVSLQAVLVPPQPTAAELAPRTLVSPAR